MSTLSILKFRATACAAAILAVVSLAPALHAQDQTAFGKVNVPFAFDTGLHHFKPGTYTVSMETPTIVRIQGATDSGFVMIQLGGDRQPVTKSKVVFRKSGDRYFLGQIWIAQESSHLDVVKSKAERRMQVAGKQSEPAGVELALLETAR
jgi:hypothetical protein